MNIEIIKALENHQIKATPMRMLVLEQLTLHTKSLSLNEIEDLLYPSDRITIYRTLNTFIKNGLVHTIDTKNKGTFYALCSDKCHKDEHYDHHPHFYCERCEKIFCSDNFKMDMKSINSDFKFKITKVEVKISGICEKCNQISK